MAGDYLHSMVREELELLLGAGYGPDAARQGTLDRCYSRVLEEDPDVDPDLLGDHLEQLVEEELHRLV